MRTLPSVFSLPHDRTLFCRAWLAYTGILLLTTTVFVQVGHASRFKDRPRVIPDTEGAIAEIAIHYLQDMNEDLEPLYRDLFEKLPEDVHVQIICPSRVAVDQFLKAWWPKAVSAGRRVQLVDVERSITLWSRDRRIARHRMRSYHPASQFIPVDYADYEEDKRNEILMAPDLVRAHAMRQYLIGPLYLEGGNIVSNERDIFIGANALSDNALLGFEDRRLVDELERLLGAQPIIIKDNEGDVPFCHVDMYLTPLDDKTVLVASPAEGLSVILEDENSASKLPNWVVDTLDTSAETVAKFDFIALLIERLGYQVLRIPALIDGAQSWMVTYNNVLIDRRAASNIVYMPIYQIPTLDEIAENTYCKLGFEVRTVDVSRIYELGGAARCVVNVTRRKRTVSSRNNTQHRFYKANLFEIAVETDNDDETHTDPEYGDLVGTVRDSSGRMTQ